MRRSRWILLLVLVACGVWSIITMPPASQHLSTPSTLRAPVRGVMHVHTRRSDGTGTVDSVAAAAAEAGLNFVIVTDHGDAAREPEPPAYRHGVLCIDAVEVSTNGGHVVTLGMPRSPYPLGGEAQDVVDDIERMGGMAIAAHPSSAKQDLRWSDWHVPIDGLEWLNGDSEWRDESALTLTNALLTYPFRRAETLGTLLDRPEDTLNRWDNLSSTRRVVAVAGADAHARIAIPGVVERYSDRISLRLPGYSQVFRAFSISLPDITLTGDARADARAVIDAIRQGQVFSSIDALASPAAVSFSASSGGTRAGMGDDLVLRGAVTLHVETNAPPGATISLLRDGRVSQTSNTQQLEYQSTDTGAYRVEIQLPAAPGQPPIPWVVTNPIYALTSPRPPTVTTPVATPTESNARYTNGEATGWRIEKSVNSRGVLDVVSTVGGTQLSLRYALGGTVEEGPYVALAMPVAEGLSGYDRITFTGHANRPTRLFIQLRVPTAPSGQSWHRSVFLDENPRTVTVMFDEVKPRGPTATEHPPLADVRDVLFVLDTINTQAGANGQLWLDDVKLGK